MKNIIFILFLLYTVSSKAQDVDFGALFVESLENLESELLRTPGCQFRNEDGEIAFSSDDENQCDQIKSQTKRSLSKFKRAIRNNFRDNLDLSFQIMCPSIFSSSPEGVSSRPPSFRPEWSWDLDIGRMKYNVSRQEFKCKVFDLKYIRDLGLGSYIQEDTEQILCCEMSATVKTKDFSEYEVDGLVRAGLQIAQGEHFKAELEARGEGHFESSSGQTETRGFVGLSVNLFKN